MIAAVTLYALIVLAHVFMCQATSQREFQRIHHLGGNQHVPEWCGENVNIAECLFDYFSSDRRILSGSHTRYARGHPPINSIQNENMMGDTVKRSSLEELCPESSEEVICLKHYLTETFKDILNMDDVNSGTNSNEANKRSRSSLCPSSSDKIECFNNFLAFWANMVQRDRASGKLTYPNKRSRDASPVGDGGDDGDDGHGGNKIMEQMNKRRYIPLWDRLYDRNMQLDRTVDTPIGRFLDRLRRASKKSLCDDAEDNLACFDKYLTIYTKIKGPSKPSRNRYVGKRAVSLNNDMCAEQPEAAKVVCYARRLQELRNQRL